MDTARRDTHQHVAHTHLRTVDQARLLDHAAREARNIVLAAGIHARHLGRFAADECTAGLTAAFGHTRHDRFDLRRLVVPHGYIIQEEERLGPLRQHVVHAHSHGVDADRVVLIHLESQLELGSHAVGTAHEHRLLDIKRREIEHSAEGADVTHHAQPRGRSHVFLDAAHHFVSGLEVHTGLFITFRHNNSWF